MGGLLSTPPMHPGHIGSTDAITWGDDMHKYYRFTDLKAAGIVHNRMTLSRWIKLHGFPPGVLLGPNTRAWRADDIERWLAERTHISTEEYVTDRPPSGGMPERASTAPHE